MSQHKSPWIHPPQRLLNFLGDCNHVFHRRWGTFDHFLIFFNWRIIAFQNFVVFCHTSTRISHRYTHVLFFPNLPPTPIWSHPTLQPVTEPLFEFSESHSRFPLAIYFTYGTVNFHVTLSIHLTSLFPSPHVHSLFSMSVSPLLSRK